MPIVIENHKRSSKLTIEITEKAYDVLEEVDITYLGLHVQKIISEKLEEQRK